ncbi:hypothetical protein KP509_04G035100 [Ceratopteris richardii]|uniref:J domain-containing protein n=1 Tax=Ceratopteris richardii TaxID=49495 RepID=A0A8T2URY0_CERRI|nr:hypothetical protein KP509_04G035100 [Ceratopteris richardii]
MGITEKSEERRKTKKRKKSRKRHYISSSPASSETSTYSDGNRKKKNREVSKKHQHVSSSPSSSEISTYSDEKRKKKKRKQRRISSESDYDSDYQKQRKRRHTSRCGKEEKKSHGRHSSKRTNSKTISDIYEDHDSKDLPGPEEVGSAMLHKFPELADDLRQLLKMLDEGQAVDLSGLENDHVATYLKQLFQSLQLRKTGNNMYFLPEGAPMKTLDVLSSIFLASAKIDVSINQSNSSKKEESQELNNLEQTTTQYGPSEQRKRVLGPAMPSAEMLEAAAQLTQAGPSVREVEEDIGMEPFIGPPPPAAVKEAESSNEAERFEEVERILAPDIENAYELLGLRVGAAAESMKKRYWKLSLLVHPDKCTHPRAHEAFTALNQAFKDLQDPAKRAKIEEQIQEKETRAEFENRKQKERQLNGGRSEGNLYQVMRFYLANPV